MKELYLDGCENVNDDLFKCTLLTKEEQNITEQFEQYFKNFQQAEELKNQGEVMPNLTSGIADSSIDPFDINSIALASGNKETIISIPVSANNVENG